MVVGSTEGVGRQETWMSAVDSGGECRKGTDGQEGVGRRGRLVRALLMATRMILMAMDGIGR